MNRFHELAVRSQGLLWALPFAMSMVLVGCGGGGGSAPTQTSPPPPVNGPAWWGFARDAQHSAQGAIASQPLSRSVWTTPVDLAPQYDAYGELLIHYGSPLMTSANTVLVPVKTASSGSFRVDARAGASGTPIWSADSDYVLPSHDWTPSFNPSLTQTGRVYFPGSGGKVFYRDDADSASGMVNALAFYGTNVYMANSAEYDGAIFINTPLTADSQGNVFFGFIASTSTPAGLVSGIARIGSDGTGSWVGAAAAAGDAAISKVAMNSAPAVSGDLATLYVAVNTVAGLNGFQTGYLLALDTTTLMTKATLRLLDPVTGLAAWISDNSTASPTVGPDGDVYFGVLESNAPGHNYRGWLLHFDSALGKVKIPGSFGWDDTASIVPAAMVPSYTGSSAYLVMTKYNNYGGRGTGDGKNRVAVLDPNNTEADPVSGNQVMAEVLTVLGPTPDPNYPGGVKEWCINSAAVDPLTKSILVNSEDGYLYRWDMGSNQLTQRIPITQGIGEAYTPTSLGPDGTVYAINNAILFAIGN